MTRRFVLAAGMALALLAGLAAPATGQEAAPTPTLTVTPSTGLVDGQHVAVQGTGWQPARPYFEECEVGTTRCWWYRDQYADTATDGTLSADVEVRAYFVSQYEGPVDCRATACELRANPYDGAVTSPPPVPLSFDPDAPLLPQPTITVTPDRELVDGDVVVVHGTNFTPGDWLEYDECAAGAFSYFDRCSDLANGRLLPWNHDGWPGTAASAEFVPDRVVGPDGSFVERLPVYAEAYTVPGRLHCRVDSCDLAVAVVGAGAIVARAPLSFEPGAPLRGPATISVTPSTGLVHHQRLTVRGTGFYGREPLMLSQCTVGREYCLSWNFKHPLTRGDGSFEVRLVVNRTVRVRSGRRVDCRVAQCVIRLNRYFFAPGPDPADVLIEMAP